MTQTTDEFYTGSSQARPVAQPATEKPVMDLSPRVVELARKIDRLPPGTYEIEIVKGEVRAVPWQVEITRTERLESFTVSKHQKE